MALDTEDFKLLTDLQSNMEERIVSAIHGSAKGVRAKVESEVNRIDEMDKIRNGRIADNEEEIEIVKDETKLARWVQRNKRLTVIIAALFIFAVAFAYHELNFKRTIEKYFRIELNENP